MKKLFILALVPVATFLLAPAAHGQAKKGTDKATLLDTSAADYTALVQYKGVTGKIVSLSPNGTAMTLRVEYQILEPKNAAKKPATNPPNPYKGILTQQQLMHELEQIQRIKNPVVQQERLILLLNKVQNQQQKQQIQQTQWVQKQLQQQANNYKTVTYAKEFEVTIVPNVHVAKKLLGLEYDDKGNVKEYPPEELKKMKDDLYPDYFKAKLAEVSTGLTVAVVFGKAKEVVKDKAKAEGDKDKAKPEAKGDDKTPPLPDVKAEDKKVDDKDKPGKDVKPDDKAKPGADVKPDDKAKPGVDIADILNGKGPESLSPTAAKGPTVQAIIILSEPGIADTIAPPKKKN